MKVNVPVVRCGICDASYVLRLSLVPGDWLYQRDCKHKQPPTGSVAADKVETAPLTVLGDDLREQLLEAFGTDDVAAIARGFDKGTRAMSIGVGTTPAPGTARNENAT